MPRVKKARFVVPYPGCDLEKEGVCYHPEFCRFWKRCHEDRGTVFSHPWGKKMLLLLDSSKPTEPKKDRELDHFLDYNGSKE